MTKGLFNIVFAGFITAACSSAIAGIPIGNSALSQQDQQLANALCTESKALDAAAAKRDAKNPDDEQVARIVSLTGEMICGFNGHPPSVWRCVLDLQRKGATSSDALDKCREDK